MSKSSSQPQIRIRNLIKIYKKGFIEVVALRGINLDVEEGELLAIVGPSGSGKSTLMNVIGGVTKPTAGTIKVQGEEISHYSENQLKDYRRDKIGFVWQIANLLPDLTIVDNIKFCMQASGKYKGHEINTRANTLLDRMGILNWAKHRPNQVSGGQLQRASIAMALANDPLIILADEPTGELDTETTKQVMEFFHQLNEEYHKSMIIVTHAPLVAKMTKRIITIRDGELLESGGTLEWQGKIIMDEDGTIKIPEAYAKHFLAKRLMIEKTEDDIWRIVASREE